MLWHGSLEVQPAGYCGLAIFSAVTKWRQSFSNHEYLGYSEAFGSLNRAKLNEYLVHMYSIYQDGIGVGRRYQALRDKAEFLCCIFQKEQAIAMLAWVQSKGKAISCPFSSPQSLSRKTYTQHPAGLLQGRAGDDLEEVTHQWYKCCLCTMTRLMAVQMLTVCAGGLVLLLTDLLMAKSFHEQL